jgi:hypothetical protein
MLIISEPAFRARLRTVLPANDNIGAVTGPGRSGAVAAVYASHILGVPFIPYGATMPPRGRLLIVDTARATGRTLRKAASRYQDCSPVVVVAFEEPPRVAFWYEWERMSA